MKKFLIALGTLATLPVLVLVWALYVLPIWALGGIRFSHWECFLLPVFYLDSTTGLNWYRRLWFGWAGQAGPNFIIINKNAYAHRTHCQELVTIKHEVRHCQQQWAFGLAFYPAYGLCGLYIALFRRDLRVYLDNPFEIDARRYAGQMITESK